MSSPARLLTIPISHYCEKARWALELAGVDYAEERHLQLIHRFHSWRAGGDGKVPVLLSEGQVLDDSSEILRWADQRMDADDRIYPPGYEAEVGAWESRLDEGLGIEGRRLMYSVVLGTDLPFRYGLEGVPGWERRLLPLVAPGMRWYAARVFDASAERVDAAFAATCQAFDRVEAAIADGRRYLVGDRFTAADLTFAALAGAVLWPERYGVPLPDPSELPDADRRRLEELRERPGGRFALRLVADHRPWPTRGRIA